MRDNNEQTVKIELLSQWKLEAEFRKNSLCNYYGLSWWNKLEAHVYIFMVPINNIGNRRKRWVGWLYLKKQSFNSTTESENKSRQLDATFVALVLLSCCWARWTRTPAQSHGDWNCSYTSFQPSQKWHWRKGSLVEKRTLLSYCSLYLLGFQLLIFLLFQLYILL